MRQTSALLVIACVVLGGQALASDQKAMPKQPPRQKAEVPPGNVDPANQTELSPPSVDAPKKAEFTPGSIDAPSETYQRGGIMANFIDFDDSGLGSALGYLLWGELTTTLGAPPRDYSIEVLSASSADSRKYPLQEDYHVSAMAMAKDYQAPLTFWGAVRKKKNDTTVNTFLTLRPEIPETDFTLGVSMSTTPPSRIEASLTRTRYEFTDSTKRVDELFKRRLVVRSDTFLLDEPREGGARVAELGDGEVLTGSAMKGPWYQVTMSDGKEGYVDIEKVKVLPTAVNVNPKGTVGRDGPADHHGARTLPTDKAELPVLDVATDERGRTWYRVALGTADVWVDNAHATPIFSFPAMHFLAGVYYFRAPENLYACQYKLAAEHFTKFISAASSTTKNTNLAAAHQLYAAAMLLSDETCGRDDAKAITAYTNAIDLTPFDSTAYDLRAVANLGSESVGEPVVADLSSALSWDVQDSTARVLIETLYKGIALGALIASADVQSEIDRLYRTVTRENVVRNMARIRQQHHLSLDTKGKHILPAPQQDVVLTLLNRSEAPLDVYVLETDSDLKSGNYYHVALPNGDKTEIRVAPGTYEIAAEAPDPGVKAIYGEHTYSSPSHYELDFLVRLNDAPINPR